MLVTRVPFCRARDEVTIAGCGTADSADEAGDCVLTPTTGILASGTFELGLAIIAAILAGIVEPDNAK